jgi:predicted secreted protein
MPLRGTGRALLLALCTAAAGPAAAEAPELPRNQVSFGVEVTRDVENDWVVARLGVTAEDADPARLADRINQEMAWALGIARGREAVKARSGGYTTLPISEPKTGRLRHWRGSQELLLESGDPKALAALVGELQARLQLEDLAFGVSPERRRLVEEELVDAVLEAFRRRAERMARKLGAKTYTIVSLNVGTSGAPPPMPLRAKGMAMEMDAAMAPPALEGGTSSLGASAHATIELQL